MKTPYDVDIKSWEHLAHELFFESWDPVIHRHRSAYIFRGVSGTGYDLQTSLQRHLVDMAVLERLPYRISLSLHEHAILRNFRKYAHRDASPGDSDWNWLSVAQHHGLPTRLLDWTFSPYVAVFFATDEADKFGLDGAVWCVHTGVVRDNMPRQCLDLLRAEHAWLFDVRILDRLAADLQAFDAAFPEPTLVFFEPPSLDDRIVNQSGMFSVMSSPAGRIDYWLNEHPGSFRRLVIPAALKPEVRDKLDMMNLTERVIYPGLDGLAKWLKRHYSPAAAIKAHTTDAVPTASDGKAPPPKSSDTPVRRREAQRPARQRIRRDPG